MIPARYSHAERFLHHYWDGRLPVDVRSMAEKSGVLIQNNPPFGCSGQISIQSINDNKRVVIDINATDAPVRQRFTIAHELGHWALGHLNDAEKCFRDPVGNFALASHDKREIAANRFAAELLMPAQGIEWALKTHPKISVQALAELFKVSGAAMEFRLTSLGLLSV